MRFYCDKFRLLRKNKKLSVKEVAEKTEISRVTLWEWEKGRRVPSETRVRMLAHVLDFPVSEISDLPDEKPVSNVALTNYVHSWLSFVDEDDSLHEQHNELLEKIQNYNLEFKKVSVIVKALVKSMDSMYYIKDSNLKYITANSSFLNNLSIDIRKSVLGKRDINFFSYKYAERNFKHDQVVMRSGEALIKHEDYIPGGKRKK